MGFFDAILSTLGLGKAKAATPAATQKPATASPTAPAAPAAVPETVPAAPAAPEPMPMIDVVAQLEARAAKAGQKLNWRTSIVDLLKLLDIDSSFAARKALAVELDCPAALMADSAQMNMWLHKTVLARLAANGGNVPADLLD
jgi:hypothetical protein